MSAVSSSTEAVAEAAAAPPARARDSTARSPAPIRTGAAPSSPVSSSSAPSASSRRFTSAPGIRRSAASAGCIRFPSLGPSRRKSGFTIHSGSPPASSGKTTSRTFNSSASKAR